MAVFTDSKGDIKIIRVVILVVAIGLMIGAYFWLNNPIKGDSCDPPRTHLDSIFSVSGQVLWILFVIGLLVWSFTRGKETIRQATKFSPDTYVPRSRFVPKMDRFRSKPRSQVPGGRTISRSSNPPNEQ
jgi:hypothetical protein